VQAATWWRRGARLALLLALLLISNAARAAEPMPDPPGGSELLPLGPAIGILTLPRAAPGTMRRPGAPWPVAILLPDGDGGTAGVIAYGDRLLENGIALLEAPDGAEARTAAWLAAGLAAIEGDARLDGRRVAVLGLGAGARAALLALAAQRPAMATPVALALLYPGCDATLAEAARGLAAGRVLLLHGEADPANGTAACEALAAAIPPAARARRRMLAGTGYGWDALGLAPAGAALLLPDPAGQGGRLRAWPDPAATLVAADHLLGFLLAAFGR
jgi:dienelactone hydrolase